MLLTKSFPRPRGIKMAEAVSSSFTDQERDKKNSLSAEEAELRASQIVVESYEFYLLLTPGAKFYGHARIVVST